MLNFATGLIIWCSQATTLAVVLFVAWRHDRKSDFYLFWSIGFALSAIGFAMVAARGIIPDFLSIEVGNTASLLGLSAWIGGFTRLKRLTPGWWCLLPPIIWLCGVFLPWIHDSYPHRVALYNLASATGGMILAATALPEDSLRDKTRLYLSMTFLAQSCVCLATALFVTLLGATDSEAIIYGAIASLFTAFLLTIAYVLCGRLIMERAERRWRRLSTSDALTSVLNRRGLQHYYSQMIEAVAGSDLKLAALLFDLDHFKAVNDRHGHQTGDLVLCEFARIATQSIPAHAAFGRMGGEEFMAFAIVSDQAEAEAIAELVRSELCRAPLLAGVALVPVTVSVGMAMMPAASVDWDKLVSAADRALYAAKNAGRNCTVIFDERDSAKATDAPPDPNAGEIVPTLDDQIHALRRMGSLSRI